MFTALRIKLPIPFQYFRQILPWDEMCHIEFQKDLLLWIKGLKTRLVMGS